MCHVHHVSCPSCVMCQVLGVGLVLKHAGTTDPVQVGGRGTRVMHAVADVVGELHRWPGFQVRRQSFRAVGAGGLARWDVYPVG